MVTLFRSLLELELFASVFELPLGNSFSSRPNSEFVCWKRSDYDLKFPKS